jgi:hypothetical protein
MIKGYSQPIFGLNDQWWLENLTGYCVDIDVENLPVGKVSSRWVPHTLLQAQKRIRVELCEEMWKIFYRRNPRRVSDIVTGEWMWIYEFDPENSNQWMVWIFPDEHQPTRVNWPRNVSNCNFLLQKESCRQYSPWWKNCYCSMVCSSVFTKTFRKSSRTAAKGRTVGNRPAPWKCISAHNDLKNSVPGVHSG